MIHVLADGATVGDGLNSIAWAIVFICMLMIFFGGSE